jgi:hypothetical protein
MAGPPDISSPQSVSGFLSDEGYSETPKVSFGGRRMPTASAAYGQRRFSSRVWPTPLFLKSQRLRFLPRAFIYHFQSAVPRRERIEQQAIPIACLVRPAGRWRSWLGIGHLDAVVLERRASPSRLWGPT